MSELLGKWQQPQGQAFPGLYFEFRAGGSYRAVFEDMGITSSGTFTALDGIIDMDQTEHTFGLIGRFQGRYTLEGDVLTMTLGDPGGARPESIEGKNKRLYKKMA